MADQAVLNQLLEQADNASAALAEQAQEAGGVVDELLERAEALAETVTERAEEAHRASQDLLAKLETADDALDQHATRAGAGLDAVPARAAATQARVDALLAAVTGRLAGLQATQDEVAAETDRRCESVGSDLAGLAEQARALLDAAEGQWAAATERLEAFHSAVTHVREEVQRVKTELIDALDALEGAAREQVERFVEGMGAALTAHTTALFDLEHRLKDAHNDAVVALRKKFAEEVVSRLPTAAASLTEALESLSAFCAEEEPALADECARLVEGLELTVQSAERARAVLRSADR